MGFGAVYKPPSVNYGALSILDDVLASIKPEVDEIICMGDFNINFHDIAASSTRYLKSVFDTYNLTQIINQSTRITPFSDTLIDLIVITNPSLILNSGTLPLSAIADHDLVFCVVDLPKESAPQMFYYARDFSGIGVELLRQSVCIRQVLMTSFASNRIALILFLTTLLPSH